MVDKNLKISLSQKGVYGKIYFVKVMVSVVELGMLLNDWKYRCKTLQIMSTRAFLFMPSMSVPSNHADSSFVLLAVINWEVFVCERSVSGLFAWLIARQS